jgi:hypothetical protein
MYIIFFSKEAEAVMHYQVLARPALALKVCAGTLWNGVKETTLLVGSVLLSWILEIKEVPPV